MTLLSAALLLFLVMDPFGNIPFFLSSLRHVPPERHRRIILRELLVALAALSFFLFFGRFVLSALHIAEPSLTIAGGIILFLIAIRMIFPPPPGARDPEIAGEPFIVPLAIPLVAGPSALSSVMVIMSRDPDRWPQWLAALLIAWALSGLILFAASDLRRFLGKRGIIAMERLMGMVLTTIAVEMLLSGIKEFLAS